jgi:hypothetical protein
MMHRAPLQRVRLLLGIFVLGLISSGLTAIPLRWEVGLLEQRVGRNPVVQARWPELADWIGRVNTGVQHGYGQYPFLAYGTDWLAFGHVAIAAAFVGAWQDPLRNRWVVEFGMIACLLVLPWAAVFGALRGIPVLWRLIDMSFGIFGIIPLWVARRLILQEGAGL